MEECLIAAITRKTMLATLRKEPNFSGLFMTYLVTRSNRIERTKSLLTEAKVVFLPKYSPDLNTIEQVLSGL